MNETKELFHDLILSMIKDINKINYKIITRQIDSIVELKNNYGIIIKNIDNNFSPVNNTGKEKKEKDQIKNELLKEIDKFYTISLKIFKSLNWGDFSKINKNDYPELNSMMVNIKGDLLRSYDDFAGCVAMMDFHGYTQFSNEIKYNKTPLQEFGETLPKKIEHICKLCKTIVYEMEGDALILVGPENPVYILNAVLSIIELVSQKQLQEGKDPKKFHGIEIKNPMIKSFQMNAAITTGGETFINRRGNVIGTIISEASRILKIVNIKKPYNSGVMISEKIFRKLEKYKEEKTNCHLSLFDFKFSDVYTVDVKGMRLYIREIYLEEKNYILNTNEFLMNLSQELKKKSPSKWYNILIYYVKAILSTINNIKLTIQYETEEYKENKIKQLLYSKLDSWIKRPSPDIILSILKLTNAIFLESDEVRDNLAIYHEFVQESYRDIAERLEKYYYNNIKKIESSSPALKKIIDTYNIEMEKIKDRLFPRRIIETILTDSNFHTQLNDVPYIGKR